MAVENGREDSVGLETVSPLRGHVDDQMGLLQTEALVLGWTARRQGPAPSVSRMQEELCRDIAVAEAREMVCTRGAPLRRRSLAAWGDLVAADSRVVALVDGETGTLLDMVSADEGV